MGLSATNYYIQHAVDALDLSDRLSKMLINPYRIVKTNLSVELDNGQIGNFMGYRIQHNNILGADERGIAIPPFR